MKYRMKNPQKFTLVAYGDRADGLLKLYIYDNLGRPDGGRFVQKNPYMNGDLTPAEARSLCESCIKDGKEVRVINDNHHVVFHSYADGEVFYPPDGLEFWGWACLNT